MLTKEQYERVVENWKRYRQSGRSWMNQDWANNVDKSFKRRVKAVGVDTKGKKFCVHTLRKCSVQNRVNYLPINAVKSFAGHTDISTTVKFYSTVNESHFENAQRVSSELLNKAVANAESKTTDVFARKEGKSERRKF